MIQNAFQSVPNIYAGFGDGSETSEAIAQKFPHVQIFSLKQIHSNIVISTDSISKDSQGDALVSSKPNELILVVTADCIPLLALGKKTIGACHAGWRGVENGVITNWIQALINSGEEPAGLKIELGPHIQRCHFEVGADVATKLQACTPHVPSVLPHPDSTKRFVNLKEIARAQLLALDIKEESITISEVCTFCEKGTYHSYRRSGPGAGRQISFICRNGSGAV